MVSNEINIIGAKLPIGNELVEAGISIIDGKINKIAKKNNLPKTDQIIHAEGLLIFPGFIDAHVHLRDFRLSHKEDFYTGTCAAAAGGFTTILDMPNTVPPTASCESLKKKINTAKQKIIVNIGFHAMLTNKAFELIGMARMGILSFKLYLNRIQNDFDIQNDDFLFELMQECTKLNVPITVHAEEIPRGKKFSKNSQTPVGSLKELFNEHKEQLEINAIKRIIKLARKSRVQTHICHISAIKSLPLINDAKKDGLKISCEVTPHHLFLSNSSIEEFGPLVLTEPPIRNKANAKKLWTEMVNGSIDIIASDHAPHTLKEKLSSSLEEIPPGVPGLETTVPLLLTKINSGDLTIGRFVEILSNKPAKIFHLINKGSLKERMDADLTLIDLKAEHTIKSKNLHTKSEYSPFEGKKCKGMVSKVIIAGEVVFDSGEIIADPGIGKIVRRG